MARHITARTMHDLGLAAWFGGSLMGSVGLNGAAAGLRDPAERATAATAGWTRWAPLSAAAIGAHLLGSVRLLQTERYRVGHQDGVARSSAIKTGLTVAAVGTTAYSGVLNRKMAAAGRVPVSGATEAGAGTPSDVAATQKQLKSIQWLIPGLTAGLVGVTAWQSEQMRPRQVLAGSLPSLGNGSLPTTLASVAGGVALISVLRKRSAKSKAKATTPKPVEAPRVMPVPASTSNTADGPFSTTGSTRASEINLADDAAHRAGSPLRP